MVLDFKHPPDNVHAVRVADQEVAHRVSNEHIIVEAHHFRQGANVVEIHFTSGDRPLNRRQGYMYTLFVPDRASEVFPCFDQPDLKGRFTLSLELADTWQAVSNTPLRSSQRRSGHSLFRFQETRPISTYLFAFAAGEFQIEEAEHSGRRMRMFHRESDEAKVEENRDTIFALHATALSWLEEYTGIQYPFSKLDFVLIPAFQFGGMEHPGSILYRDSTLLLGPSSTQSQQLRRASLIAHETAHMWFGNLVTMEWFDDVWTKEVFANFMAAKIVNPSFPEVDHELRFLLTHYPGAHQVDRTEGTHPIRQELENLNRAAQLYGAIIYQKAPIVMLHLERLMGPEAFRNGMQHYLTRYQFANANWLDLIAVLDKLSPHDLNKWSHSWVEEAGRPIVIPEVSRRRDGSVHSISVTQSDPKGLGRVWVQDVECLLLAGKTERRLPLQLSELASELLVPDDVKRLDCFLVNGRGFGYGYFTLDPNSGTFLLEKLPSIPNVMVRAVAWTALWEEMLEGQVAAEDLTELALNVIASEENELLTHRLLQDLSTLLWRFLSEEKRQAVAPRLEDLLWKRTQQRGPPSLRSSFFNAYRSLATTPQGIARLESVWDEKSRIQGIVFRENDFIRMAYEIAVRGLPRAQEVLNRQLTRIQDPDRKARFAFVMPALSPNPSDRLDFFQSLARPESRTRERWVIEALGYLHHPLRRQESLAFVLPSLELLEEIQETGDIFFPKAWLDATLGGHSSPEASRIVRSFLDEHPLYAPRLRAKILQSADLLFRAAGTNRAVLSK